MVAPTSAGPSADLVRLDKRLPLAAFVRGLVAYLRIRPRLVAQLQYARGLEGHWYRTVHERHADSAEILSIDPSKRGNRYNSPSFGALLIGDN